MLKLLSITNFAVVTEATVELDEGLNLLTGETGSGKSIFVDALGLLLGARASSEIVRAGESAAFIQGIFDVQGNVALERLAAEAGIDLGDGELIVRREITAGARSRTYVNDQLVTLSLLRSLRPSLLDIPGQGGQQSLLYPDAHVELLDEFGSLQPLVDEVGRLHTSYAALRRDLATLRRTEAERLRSADILGFQLAEIERIAPVAGEDDELEQTRAILANAER